MRLNRRQIVLAGRLLGILNRSALEEYESHDHPTGRLGVCGFKLKKQMPPFYFKAAGNRKIRKLL